jgi:hypothetical protein
MSASDVITEVSSALSNAAPYAGALTAFANLGIDITQLIKPSEVDYDQQYQDQLKQAADLITALVEKPGADSGAAFTTFLNELLVSAGRPVVGGISATEVSIRVDHLLNLVSGTAELVLYLQLFLQLNATKQPQQQAPIQLTNPVATPKA